MKKEKNTENKDSDEEANKEIKQMWKINEEEKGKWAKERNEKKGNAIKKRQRQRDANYCDNEKNKKRNKRNFEKRIQQKKEAEAERWTEGAVRRKHIRHVLWATRGPD